MGWEIEKKRNRYKIWTSTSNKYLTRDWKTRNQIIKIIDSYNRLGAKLETIKGWFGFPCGWALKKSKDGIICCENKEGLRDYCAWHLDALEKKDYFEIVEAKYKEILKELEKES